MIPKEQPITLAEFVDKALDKLDGYKVDRRKGYMWFLDDKPLVFPSRKSVWGTTGAAKNAIHNALWYVERKVRDVDPAQLISALIITGRLELKELT